MAVPGKINKDNVKDIQEHEIKNLTVEQLEAALDAYEKIEKINGQLYGDDLKRYNLLLKYNRELKKTNEELTKADSLSDKIEKKTRSFENILNGINTLVTAPMGMMKALGGEWGKADQAANDFGKHVGLNTKGVAQLRDETVKFANSAHIGINYNTSIAEMITLQERYTKSVGRNLQLADNQREVLLATSKIMGENTVEFTRKLENMGVGLERSGDIAAKMFNEASKSGISFEKYSKSVTDNLTKVQTYGFRNGVEGLTSMAKKAAEVNLNIAEAFKVADKIQSGGIESAIKMGAGLQVLGGSFAQFGDPMAMLYEGLNDAEGLQDRLVNMFSGNARIENGQAKFSTADRLRMRAAAEAMGVSGDEMFQMASRRAIMGQIEKQMSGNAAIAQDAELAEFIKNTATLNKNGEAVVNINGEEKKVSEIEAKDKEYLKNLQKTESEDIKDIAQILRGYTDAQKGFTTEVENRKASAFSEVGKWTKGLYGWAGKNNAILNIIMKAVLAMQLAQMVGGVAGGFSRIGNGVRGFRGGGAAAGFAAAGGGSAAVKAGTGTVKPDFTTSVSRNGTLLATNYEGSGISQRTLEKLSRKYGSEVIADSTAVQVGAEAKDITSEALRAEKRLARWGKTDAQLLKANEKLAARGINTATKFGSKAVKTTAFLGSTAGKAITGGALLGGGFAALEYAMNGNWKGSRADKNKAWGGTIGATIGGIASLLGPIAGIAGTMIGQQIGERIGGAITKRQNKNRAEARSKAIKELGGKQSKLGKDFEALRGDYSRGELEKIKNAIKDGNINEKELNKKLLRKMAESGDKDLIEKYGDEKAKAKINKQIDKINGRIDKGEFSVETGEFTLNNASLTQGIEPVAMASGGKLYGDTDINGPGMPILGSNIRVGGGEFVVNADATARNEGALNYINSGGIIKMSGGGSIPENIKVPIDVSSIKPANNNEKMAPMHVKESNGGDAVSNSIDPTRKLDVSPIKLDVSGTIKLDANGQQVDLNAIVNSPAFLTQLAQLIERRITDSNDGGNFKELAKNKQHRFMGV